MSHVIGKYKVTNPDGVNIRREPRIVENKNAHNRVGFLTFGKFRRVIGFQTDNDGATWGQVTEEDNTGTAGWVCLQNLNRVFMVLVEADPTPRPGDPALEARVKLLEQRMDALEAKQARTKTK